ncbi:MAG: integrase core domain-containing protein [Candidatus Brocadiaceae bacterium]|nr:integrase core domain-containing protein [Candidatus Brocadiaceae bacterium]
MFEFSSIPMLFANNPSYEHSLHPEFIARDFKEFIRVCGMTHVKTSPYYPQSNGKIERWHKSLKSECIRLKTPFCVDDARGIVEGFVEYYNTKRLHGALGYIVPKDKLEGREQTIFSERDKKLHKAREKRKIRRMGVLCGEESKDS